MNHEFQTLTSAAGRSTRRHSGGTPGTDAAGTHVILEETLPRSLDILTGVDTLVTNNDLVVAPAQFRTREQVRAGKQYDFLSELLRTLDALVWMQLCVGYYMEFVKPGLMCLLGSHSVLLSRFYCKL